MDKSRRMSGWRIVLVILGAVVIVLVGSIAWVRSVANKHCERMEKRVAALEAEFKADVRKRPVLRGQALPGNAWEDYGAALASAPQLSGDYTWVLSFDQSPLKGGKRPTTLPELLEWVAPCGAALDRLRAGTRKAELRPTLVLDGRFTPLMPELARGTWQVTCAGVVRSRELLEAGNGDEAMALLLDLCQFARDGFDGTDVGASRVSDFVLDMVIRELREDLRSKKVGEAGLRRLDTELEILEQSWPACRATLRNILLAFGRRCRQEARGEVDVSREKSLPMWRWGYSSRFRAASTFLRADAQFRAYLEAAEEGKRSPRVESMRAVGAMGEWHDPIIFNTLDDALADWDSASRTGLRLVRIASYYQATGRVLDLVDPFGGRIQVTLQDRKLRITSDVERNGKRIELEVER